ncbi:TPA: hypothetical protein ACH3X3_002549 [Trebouxia sp. C0006]
MLLTIIAMLLLLPVSRQSINQSCAGCVKSAMQMCPCLRSHATFIVNHASDFAVVALVSAVCAQLLLCTYQGLFLADSSCWNQSVEVSSKHSHWQMRCCLQHASAQGSHLNDNRVMFCML